MMRKIETITLSNDRKVDLKKLNARHGAKVLDIAAQLIEGGKVGELLTDLGSLEKGVDASDLTEVLPKVAGLVRLLANDYFDELVTLTCLCTSNQIDADRFDNDLGLDDMIAILMAAFELNNFKHLFEKLGNEQKPSSQPEGAKANGNAIVNNGSPSRVTSPISSAPPTVGDPQTLRQSGLEMPST